MRYIALLSAALAALTLLQAPAGAADGIKASATASRKVPADILTVSFHLIERSEPERQSQLRTEELRLREAITATGAQIISWTSRISMTNAGFSTATCNYINTQSQDSQAVDMRREIVVRISRQKDAEPIAAVLGRNGVRHGVQFVWSHSSAEAVREELALEATAAAVAKAQKLAALAGGKAGMILDLTNSQVGIPASAPKDMIVQGGVMNALPISSPVVDELIEEANGLVLVLRVSAIATLQSKSD